MTIETKYNIGDEVWIINEHKCCKGRIKSLNIDLYNENITFFSNIRCSEMTTIIKYSVKTEFDYVLDLEECTIFSTKEELLNSL